LGKVKQVGGFEHAGRLGESGAAGNGKCFTERGSAARSHSAQWWGERPREPLPRKYALPTAREDARPTKCAHQAALGKNA